MSDQPSTTDNTTPPAAVAVEPSTTTESPAASTTTTTAEPVAETKKPEVAVVTDAGEDDDGEPAAADPEGYVPTEEEKKKILEDNEKIEKLEANYRRFCVQSVTIEAALRLDDLVRNNLALKHIVNLHFMEQRRLLAAKYAQLPKKQQQKKTQDTTAFIEPLVIFTGLGRGGQWQSARKLDLTTTPEGKPNTPADFHLVDKRTYTLACNMADAGLQGFMIVVDALERTAQKLICRYTGSVRLSHRDVPSVFQIKDDKQRLAELVKISRLQIFTTTAAIEDTYDTLLLVKLEQRMLEEATKNGGKSAPEDAADRLEVIGRKKIVEIDSNAILDELRLEATEYAKMLVSQNALDVLIHVLIEYPLILEEVERQIASNGSSPTVVTIPTRSSYPMPPPTKANPTADGEAPHYLSTKKLGEALASAKANNESTVERLQALYDRCQPSESRSFGANAIVLEIVDTCVGILLGTSTNTYLYVPDIMALKPKIEAQRALSQSQDADRTFAAKQLNAPPRRTFEKQAADLQTEMHALITDTEMRRTATKEQWAAYKKKILAEYEAKLEELEKQFDSKEIKGDDDDDVDDKATTADAAKTTSTTTTSEQPKEPAPSVVDANGAHEETKEGKK